MKSILLTTTALVAFAGAAAAEGHTGISFTGSATLGYNDDQSFADDFTGGDVIGDNRGFYWEGTLGVNLAQELDNGVMAGASFEVDFVDGEAVGGNGENLISGDYVLSLTTEDAGLFFGDTPFAALSKWRAAGDMEADGFSEADGETALRGDLKVADIDVSISYVIGNNNAETNVAEDLNQLSLGAAGSFGNFGFNVAYQAESDEAPGFYSDRNDPTDNFNPDFGDNGDFTDNEIFGVSVNTTLAGATITLAYADRTGFNGGEDITSTGIQVAYPFGPVTATVYYVAEDNAGDEDNYGATIAYADGPISVALDYDYDQGVDKIGLDGAYDLGNGLTLRAGVYDQSNSSNARFDGTDFYVAGTYDLGGGAELLVSYADAETGDAIDDDEVGAPDYQVGTTVAVSFSF